MDIQCGNCKSYKVKVYDLKYKITMGCVILALGFSLSLLFNSGGIGVMLGVIGYASMLISLAYFYLAISHKTIKYRCKSCGNVWKNE